MTDTLDVVLTEGKALIAKQATLGWDYQSNQGHGIVTLTDCLVVKRQQLCGDPYSWNFDRAKVYELYRENESEIHPGETSIRTALMVIKYDKIPGPEDESPLKYQE